MTTTALLDTLGRELRFGLRTLRLNPAFALVTLLTLAIGIGANTAVFSVLNAVLLKPLAYPNPGEIVAITQPAPGAPNPNGRAGGIPDLPLSASMYLTYSEQSRSFQKIGVWWGLSSTVTGLAEPEQVRGVTLTLGTLEVLGVRPILGRWLSQADEKPEGAETIMLGYGYWQRRFGGDPSVIGRRIIVDSHPREIVGVMPQNFRVVTADPELIFPLAFDRSRLFQISFEFNGIARLKPGVTIEQATADLVRLIPVWMDSWPPSPFGGTQRGFESWKITPTARPLKESVVGNIGGVLWVVMGTVGIVMLITCANVANLLLVRAEGRQQELAVRAALGAGSARIVRELLLESVLLGLMGGALGVGLAYLGLRLLVSTGPATLPRLHEISLDLQALAFTLGISLLAGILFGLIPAFKHASPWIAKNLRMGGRALSHSRERHRARNILVAVQVALALVLLVSSGLMIHTLFALRAVDPGFTNPEALQLIRIAPQLAGSSGQRTARMLNDILDKLKAIPGVASAGFISAVPMESVLTSRSPLLAETDNTDLLARSRPLRWHKFVSPEYFRTAGTRLIAGRDYTWTDVYDLRNVAIVSESLAREFWGTPDQAIGKRVRSVPTRPWREVIGVVQDVREIGAQEPAPPTVYWPSLTESLYQAGELSFAPGATFVIRTARAGTDSFVKQVQEAVWSVNPNLPAASVRTMDEVYKQSMARTSFTLVMLAIAGAMALALGIIGIYGVISYAVSQRTREIGIRLALGAQQAALRRMFVRYGLTLAGAGVIMGMAAAFALTRLMTSLLFNVSPLDPWTYAAVPLVLIAAAVVASYLPARRASSVDPIQALKTE